ncbi:MAG: hypothetical protein QXQ29_02385 [Candidatus Bathyarchaeia archaeon]
MTRPALWLSILSISIPFTSIATSIAISGWFNIIDNALSDLGHAIRSPVAPIFNFGLSLGGLLISIVSTLYFGKLFRILSVCGVLVGYTLILVAVFDEVYRSLHFTVSVAFFLSIALTLSIYAYLYKNPLAVFALILGLASWLLHLSYGIPRGAAIPELISIAVAIPFYIDLARRIDLSTKR